MSLSERALDSVIARRARASHSPVRAGVIGCGDFGRGIVAQAASAPLVEISAAADRSLDAARQAYRHAGVPDEAIVECENGREALLAFEGRKRVIVADAALLMELPLDVIVEATGHPESGARHAALAIRHGRHVAMVNKEADVTVVLYVDRNVKANFAFKKGELKEKEIEEVVKALPKILPSK